MVMSTGSKLTATVTLVVGLLMGTLGVNYIRECNRCRDLLNFPATEVLTTLRIFLRLSITSRDVQIVCQPISLSENDSSSCLSASMKFSVC